MIQRRWLPWLWPLFILAALILRELLGDTTWWSLWTLAISESIWPVVALFVFAIVSIRHRRWHQATFVAVLVSLFSIRVALHVPRPEGLKVMQLNMRHGLDGLQRICALIDRERPDVLCLQEAGPLSAYPHKVESKLAHVLRDYTVFHSQFEAIAVRGELLESGKVDLDEVDSEKAWFDQKVITHAGVRVQGRKLRIATVHFTPRPASKIPGYSNYREFARVRRSQHLALANLVRRHPDDAWIVAGDFNGQPHGPNYRTVTDLLEDCYREAGRGFGYTIRSTLPHKRSDYIFVRNLKPTSCFVLGDIVSDHRAVVAWVK